MLKLINIPVFHYRYGPDTDIIDIDFAYYLDTIHIKNINGH